jgi:hypothetical protein
MCNSREANSHAHRARGGHDREHRFQSMSIEAGNEKRQVRALYTVTLRRAHGFTSKKQRFEDPKKEFVTR